ncbi:hypothetical protein C6A37_07940 [Desulfobacteraceae bacterium SEEP-SAG9]|nr:hypothetical protein C6A37_07940 [Desulfobacteraceae bacterium SEEP-SAG9]
MRDLGIGKCKLRDLGILGLKNDVDLDKPVVFSGDPHKFRFSSKNVVSSLTGFFKKELRCK